MTAPLKRARRARALGGLLALLASRFALAQQPEDKEPDTSAADTVGATVASPGDAEASPPWRTRFGARLVAGAPEGLSVAALVHPRRWLRVYAGAARDTLGLQARAGVDLIPIELPVSPLLSLEYGHGFRANYGQLLDELHGQSATAATDIQQVDYDQVSASIGLEFSPWSHLTFFGGVGISYWFIGVRDVKSFIREAVDSPAITSTPLLIGLSSPVARLGLILSF